MMPFWQLSVEERLQGEKAYNEDKYEEEIREKAAKSPISLLLFSSKPQYEASVALMVATKATQQAVKDMPAVPSQLRD